MATSSVVVDRCYGDESEVVALVKKHVRKDYRTIVRDEEGEEYIIKLMLYEHNGHILLPHLSKLPRLAGLNFIVHDISPKELEQIAKLKSLRSLTILCENEDLQFLQPLTQLTTLRLPSKTISDEGLRHLSVLKNLKQLHLHGTNINGDGLRHLDELAQLEWLSLGSTPLDDSAIPHIVSNFPKLRRANFDGTKITPEGLMQLADLHWLMTIAIPEEIVGPDPSAGATREERRALSRERHQNKLELLLQYKKKYYLSRSAARGAGLEVPAENQYPFGYSEEMEDFIRQQRGAP